MYFNFPPCNTRVTHLQVLSIIISASSPFVCLHLLLFPICLLRHGLSGLEDLHAPQWWHGSLHRLLLTTLTNNCKNRQKYRSFERLALIKRLFAHQESHPKKYCQNYGLFPCSVRGGSSTHSIDLGIFFLIPGYCLMKNGLKWSHDLGVFAYKWHLAASALFITFI